MPRRTLLALALLLLAGETGRAAEAVAAPSSVAELPGPLVLCGGDSPTEDARGAFLRLAGQEKARLVVVAGPAGKTEAERLVEGWRKVGATVAVITVRDRTADDSTDAKVLSEASGAWVYGMPAPAALDDSKLGKELIALHRRGGVVGGAVGGLPFASRLLPGVSIEPRFQLAAGLRKLRATVAASPGSFGLGIEEAGAVLAQGRTLRVMGEGGATVHIPKGAGRDEVVQPAKRGDQFDLFQLRRAALNRAARAPFPPALPADPVVAKGALLIVGGGGAGPEIWKAFIDLAGGPEASIVVIPTALEDPLPGVIGEVGALKRFGAKDVAVLHTRSRAEADTPEFSAALTKAKGVWFGGGRQWRFVDAYADTLTEKRIHEVLARGGAIGGSSAGASIQSEYMPRGHPLGNLVMAAEGYEKGFGFLPGCAVDQHFFARKRTTDMTGLMKLHPQYLGIGIDEGTAIVVKGSAARVIGRTKVAFYDYRKPPAGEPDYVEVKTGESYDLKARKKLP